MPIGQEEALIGGCVEVRRQREGRRAAQRSVMRC